MTGMRRLVLFDIDGTLLSADGAGKRAIHAALMEVFGTTGPINGYAFGGRTDPEIVRDLLRADGLEDREIDAGLPALWFRYVENLHREYNIEPTRVSPVTRHQHTRRQRSPRRRWRDPPPNHRR